MLVILEIINSFVTVFMFNLEQLAGCKGYAVEGASNLKN